MLMLCVKFAGTYDVQDIAVNSNMSNAVSFMVDYALNSNAWSCFCDAVHC